MRISFTPAIFLMVTATLLSSLPAMATNEELIDFSCPTSASDEPAIFPQSTQQLPISGVIHLKDHQHSYQLSFRPSFDPRRGYVGDILIFGRKYTRDPTTQEKIYKFDKDEFHQEVVDFPFAFCRSNKVPFEPKGDQTIGQLKIDDGIGGSRSSRVRMGYFKGCIMSRRCWPKGIGADYPDQVGTTPAIQFGMGYMHQDLRLLPR